MQILSKKLFKKEIQLVATCNSRSGDCK